MPKLSRSTLLDGRVLVLVVVLGGLVILQGSNNLDASKIVYFLLATAAVVGAVVSAPMWLSRTSVSTASLWLVASASLVPLLIVSLAVSRAYGTPIISWLRETSAYALLAAAPILALACAGRASRRWLVTVIAVCGALASVSFAISWIGRRNLADLPIDRLTLPSEPLAAALLAVATSLALVGLSRRWWWAATAGAVLGLFFISGTRSTLLLLAVPIGIAVFAGRPWKRAALVLLTEIAMAGAVFFVGQSAIAIANGNMSLFPLSSTATPSAQASPGLAGAPAPDPAGAPAPDRLGQRVSSVSTLITDPGSDQSFQERLEQTKSAWQAFARNPLFGVGPGYTFQWTNYANRVSSTFTLDTPLIYLAKFGLLGLIPLVLFAAAYLRLALALWRRREEARIEYLSLVGFAIVLLVVGLQGFPTEDKGSSFALILLVALGLQGLVRRDTTSELAGVSAIEGEPAVASEPGPAGL